jgi:hypothetical protein
MELARHRRPGARRGGAVIYGFRISVLFGLVLTICSAVIGVAAGAVQGYFGGWTDLAPAALHRDLVVDAGALHLLIIAAILPPGFFVLLGIMLLFSWVGFVGIVRAEFLRARNFEYVARPARSASTTATIMWRHLLPNAMVATLTFLPFILSGSITTLTSLDFLGFGMPPGSPSLGEMIAQGKANLQAPWLGAVRLLRDVDHAVAADLHRRGGARCVRSAEDVPVRRVSQTLPPPFRRNPLRRLPPGRARDIDRRSTASRSTSPRGETLALVGESGSGKSVSALSILKLLPYPAASHPSGKVLFKGKDLLEGLGARCARCAATTSP